MSMSDPIADLCTRIRNAAMRNHSTVSIPYSNIKSRIVDVLKNEGFIEDWQKIESEKFPLIELQLKYDKEGDSIIRKIERVSKPGLRKYRSVQDIKPILNGQGVAIVTTSGGVLSDKECRMKNVGGEVLCHVW